MDSNSLRSQSNHNPNHATALTSANHAASHEVELCAARLTPECQLAGGRIDPVRARSGNTRYCPACAYRLKLDRNAAYKRRKRREIGWRAYANANQQCPSYVPADTARKAEHASYMRAYRLFQKHWRESNLSLTEQRKRVYRRDFINALLHPPQDEQRPLATRAPVDDSAVDRPDIKARTVTSAGNRTQASSCSQTLNGGQFK